MNYITAKYNKELMKKQRKQEKNAKLDAGRLDEINNTATAFKEGDYWYSFSKAHSMRATVRYDYEIVRMTDD